VIIQDQDGKLDTGRVEHGNSKMTAYEKIINPNYIKRLNSFIQKVVEPAYKKKFNRDFKIRLKGIRAISKYSDDINPWDEDLVFYYFFETDPGYLQNLSLMEEILLRSPSISEFDKSNFYMQGTDVFWVKFYYNHIPKQFIPLDVEINDGNEEKINEDIEPSEKAVKNICDAKRFCDAQGKITFGQLKEIVTNAKAKRLMIHIGEGGYKAVIRLLPWFFPQLSIAGFTGSIIRAFNKIFRPGLEETTGYKTWWGKTIMKIFNLVEGELGTEDPLSRIFFISDGLLTMIDDKLKVKFARYIAEIASEKPDDEVVPDFFVENELRNWLNQKFLLEPPLPPKN
jgi:hypothetical protein